MSEACFEYSLSSLEMELATRVQIMDEDVYISFYVNDFGKDINPSLLSPAIGK